MLILRDYNVSYFDIFNELFLIVIGFLLYYLITFVVKGLCVEKDIFIKVPFWSHVGSQKFLLLYVYCSLI